MASNWRGITVYPPRYFAGHIGIVTMGRVYKVEFFSAPIIPVSEKEARIYCGSPNSCFYNDAVQEFADLHNRELSEIQYAISVYDAKARDYRVEKFNHPFSKETVIKFRKDHLSIVRPDGGDIYGVYDINDVMDSVSRCFVPVVQFIS